MTALAWAIAAAAVVALVVVALAARRASARAADAEALARDLVATVGEGVVRLSADGRVLEMNPPARELLGWDPAQVTSAGGWDAAVDRGPSPGRHDGLSDADGDGDGDRRELRRRPDDAAVPVHLRTRTGPAGRLVVFSDRRPLVAATTAAAEADARQAEAVARATAAEARVADLEGRLAEVTALLGHLDERRDRLDALEQELEERQEDALASEEAVRALVAEAQARSTSLDDREDHLGELEAAVEARASALDEREAELAERQGTLDELAEELQLRQDELAVTRGELAQREAELDLVGTAAAARVAEAEMAVATDAPASDAPAADRGPVPTLWAFELLRVERTWRQAMGPDAVPPATVGQDPGAELAAAVGMELDRLREESGLSSHRHGRPGPDVSPAGALVALRLLQELLAAVGPAADHLGVRVADDGGRIAITLAAEGWDAESADLGAIPLLRAEAERAGGGLTVTGEGDGDPVVELRVAARP